MCNIAKSYTKSILMLTHITFTHKKKLLMFKGLNTINVQKNEKGKQAEACIPLEACQHRCTASALFMQQPEGSTI